MPKIAIALLLNEKYEDYSQYSPDIAWILTENKSKKSFLKKEAQNLHWASFYFQ